MKYNLEMIVGKYLKNNVTFIAVGNRKKGDVFWIFSNKKD